MGMPSKMVISLQDARILERSVELKSVTLDVPELSCFALLGLPNQGKTTLIKTLAGLVPLRAGTGRVLNHSLQQSTIHRDPAIGFLHQGANWSNSLTVLEIIQLTAHDTPTTDIERLLALAGLGERRNTSAEQLSLRERQLVGLITLCLGNPSVLILDEPAGRLPPDERRAILDFIDHIRAERTIFFTTSMVSDAQQIASHVALLGDNTIITQGQTDAILTRPATTVFQVVLQGDVELVYEHLRNLAWVAEITQIHEGERTTWTLWLHDGEEAPTHLLRAILADRSLKVEQFNQIRPRIDGVLDELRRVAYWEE